MFMEKVNQPPQSQQFAQKVNQGPSFAPPAFSLTASPESAANSPAQLYSPPGKEAANHQTLPNGPWEQFAEKFNDEFEHCLHTFHADSAERYGRNNDLSGEELKALFTEEQRKGLMLFMTSSNKIIPDRLFLNDDIGKTTAQQRLIMSAHILCEGKYQPGSFLQPVHARMCYHWLQITHHYAGATTRGNDKGIPGNTDHDGNLVFANGKTEEVLPDQRVYDLDPYTDETGDVGPIHAGTGHADRAEKDPDKVFRSRELPFSDFGTIQSGDWLYYYNANPSLSGNHSVIFSSWAGPADKRGTVNFRVAWAYSQGSPSSGGRRHQVILGDQFVPGKEAICPVTRITRVDPDTRPATDISDYLPTRPEAKENNLIGSNVTYLEKFEKKNGPLNMDLLKGKLRQENEIHLSYLSGHMTPGQMEMLQQANKTDNIELLVRLTQRLRTLHGNAVILADNNKKTYQGKEAEGGKQAKEGKDAEYQKLIDDFAADQAIADEKIENIEADMEPFELQIDAEEEKMDAFVDVSDKLKQAKADFEAKEKEKKAFGGKPNKKSPRYAIWTQLKAERNELLDALNEAKAEDKVYQNGTKAIRRQISSIRKKMTPYRRKIEKIEKERSKAEKALPYGLVHPGYNKGADKTDTTGKIEDILSYQQLGEFVAEEEVVKE
jgi:hypothetical protein